MKRLMRRTRSAPTMDPQADDSTSGRRGGGGVVGHAPFRRPQRIERASAVKSEGSVHGSVPSTIIMQSSLADKVSAPWAGGAAGHPTFL